MCYIVERSDRGRHQIVSQKYGRVFGTYITVPRREQDTTSDLLTGMNDRRRRSTKSNIYLDVLFSRFGTVNFSISSKARAFYNLARLKSQVGHCPKQGRLRVERDPYFYNYNVLHFRLDVCNNNNNNKRTVFDNIHVLFLHLSPCFVLFI